ncbi:hypothetical protein KJ786_02965 [Patescibacteria group bacterium]|nr:hypothetical protein [Patescibacteria group bacterium]
MPQLSQATKDLLSQYRSGDKVNQLPEGVTTVHVDEVAAKVAVFYEKIRGIIDWREEHLLKRGAIQRTLKRHFFVGIDILQEKLTRESIAEPLVLELIRGGHYPNDKIPETKITDVQKIIEKYIFILKNIPQAESGQDSLHFYNWLLSIAACEIEETLSSSYKERALISYMYELMKERIVLNEGALAIKPLKEEEKNVQIYIAVQRALFKLDAPVISYHLLKYKYPDWRDIGQEKLLEAAKNMLLLEKKIERNLSHPLSGKFYQICEKYDTPYLLLGDILSEENPEELSKKIAEPEAMESLIKNTYNKRLSTLKTRVHRAAFYSTLSVLLTNAFSVLILEIPVAKLIYGFFSNSPFLTISVDILGPTFLMFLMVATIKPPTKNNLNIVIMETMKIIYQKEKQDVYEVRHSRQKGLIMKSIIGLIYLSVALVSFGAIYWIFYLAKFPITSAVINIMFIAIIMFTGLAIRRKSEELTVEEATPGFLGFIFDILSLPIASTGQWLSNKWKKYNIISAFFSALIDLPFMTFVRFIEQWRYFLKEKKEKMH